MILIKLLDDQIIKAHSYQEAVEKMKTSASLQDNKIEYMEGVAQRVQVYNGEIINYNTPEEFIKELHRAGIIVVLFDVAVRRQKA